MRELFDEVLSRLASEGLREKVICLNELIEQSFNLIHMLLFG